MKEKIKQVLLIAAGLACAQLSFSAVSIEQVLLKSDEIRNPQLDYECYVKVTDNQAGKKSKESTYKVLAKGREKSMVESLTPAVDRGRILLMNGSNYWGYLPNVSKPLRISMQEKLTGEVSNGDLSRANFSGDYTPSLQETKTIGKEKFYVLNLEAKTKEVTYGRVVLWVKADSNRPHYAEFYAVSGRKLKTCKYEGYRSFGGAVRPTRLTMTDAVKQGANSVIEYTAVTIKPLPEKYFTKDYMKRMGE
jgi:outer membrane lipoprotein-sorting protein